MKRVLICTEVSFPRGGAASNYIEYLALALINGGYCPIIIGQGENYKKDLNSGTYIYKGIQYYNYPPQANVSKYKIKRFIDSNFYNGKQIIQVLKKLNLTSEDYIIFYTSNGFTINTVLKYASQYGTMSSMCITEHFRKSQFENKLLYWRYLYSFNYVIAKTKSVIPISRHLEKIFKNKGCRTLLLPIMANPYEYSFEVDTSNKVCNFIYSGAAFTKDSFETMLKSFLLLTDEERAKVQFHLTGVKRENLEDYLGEQKNILEELESVLIIHPWLEYHELVDLMKRMDYLFIARETNQTTIANFPSKVPELMCYGVIPVVSRVGDYTELYLTDRKDSIIFEGCTPEVGVEALRRAIQLPEEIRISMKTQARKTAEEKFYYGIWTESLMDFIECCRNEATK
ncbi:glycosyltransferase [Mesobacillus maritimus]|uniref:glycosyltransferase n=1 Tax=Mesobacillus maritimus TaxID=1643336 RepID=UPI002041BCA6|nr:glycosyltransferase [Mesobacillus maritimus]MCM3670900.1 glycosyltransferase [Mesobacillus maritimus]